MTNLINPTKMELETEMGIKEGKNSLKLQKMKNWEATTHYCRSGTIVDELTVIMILVLQY